MSEERFDYVNNNPSEFNVENPVPLELSNQIEVEWVWYQMGLVSSKIDDFPQDYALNESLLQIYRKGFYDSAVEE